MHFDNESDSPGIEPAAEELEGSQDDTLRWLMDMDMSEPGEQLFALDQEDFQAGGLTEDEAELARRPMNRGKAGADDFATYVHEEIVISSETQSSDIYASDSDSIDYPENSAQSPADDEVMAIDYSRNTALDEAQSQPVLDEGADVLGLADDDDIGEQFLVIKRVRKETEQLPVPETAAPPMLMDAPVLRLVPAAEAPAVANEDPSATDGFAGREADAQMSQSNPGVTFEAPQIDDRELDDHQRACEVFQEDNGGIEQGLLDEIGSTAPEEQPVQGKIDDQEGLDASVPFVGTSSIVPIKVEAPAVFDEELLSGDFDEEFGLTQWEPGEGDIDAVFAGLDHTPQDVTAEEVMAMEGGDPAADIDETMQIFDESTFADDLFGEIPESGDSVADIDMVLDSVEPALQDLGGEYDLEEEESAEDDGVELLLAQAGESVTDHVEEESIASLADETVDEHVEQESFAAQGEETVDEHVEQGSVEAQDEETVNDDVEQESSPVAEGSWYIPDGITFNRASQTSGEIFTDFLDAFIEEGSSELEKLEDAIAAWEADSASEPAFTVVTRILHTIKGIAKGVGLHFYGTLIHNFETLLEALPKPVAGAEGDYFRIINIWLDAAVRGLDHVQQQRTDIPNELPQQAPVSTASTAAPGTADGELEGETGTADDEVAVASAEPSVEPAQQQGKRLADEGARVLAAQQSIRITSDKLDNLLNLSNQAHQLGVRTAQSTARGKRASVEMQNRLSSVRAHIASISDRALRSVNAKVGQATPELDALEMDQYTELHEAANILREGVEDLADLVDFASRQNVQVEALLKQQSTVIASIGSAIRAARVVPVSRLVPGLRRLVRTVSNDLDKNVSLKVLNELGTLDREDYARCQIILDHMVRNALDHGIESSQQRLDAGKPAAGQITIDIGKAGADAIITLADDGRGIDPESMRKSARKKGLDVDVEALSDEEALRLIFQKGFSTASTVSQISGRGVGMDIVLSELQQMGGDVQIESTVGRGTAFHIRIPSSVTVNGALLVTAGDQSYAIPLAGLIAVEQVPVDEFFAAVKDNTRLSFTDMECEPAYLATLCHSGASPDRKTWDITVPIIIAGSAERYMAIAVDDVEEALELVIRSLGAQFSTVPGVAGAATTADGAAIVALDLNMLVTGLDVDDQSSVCLDTESDEAVLALVVDDSRTQRMVATSQLETVGVETLTAENGGVAIELLNTVDRLPDVILLDVEMPVKDGIQTLREIRKSARYSHLPVIMITSRTGLKHRALAEAAGCNGYMGKPFNFRLLLGQINELTGYRLQLS